MAGRWYLSVALLLMYLLTFAFWRWFPSRAAFVYGGLISGGLMGWGIRWAAGRGYFANRVDLAVHAYVVADVLLEGIMYEALRLVLRLPPASDGFVYRFHDNNNFVFCALAFVLLIGGHRWYALRRNRGPAASLSERFRQEPAGL